ncbi:MAG: hypothetical protein IPM98_17005 [Lewinellaceae bacterium]|nr:hypothetical protein [Lewinellaceae bacterium]
MARQQAPRLGGWLPGFAREAPFPLRCTCRPNTTFAGTIATQQSTALKIQHFASNIFLFLLLFALPVAAQTGDAVAAFDSGYVETGNPFVLHLSVPEQLGQPADIDFSPWETLLPAQNILGSTGWQNRDGRWVNDLTLITFDSAQLWLPPLGIAFPDGDSVLTNPLELNVLPTPATGELTDLYDIKDIRREPANWRDFLLPLGIIAAGVLLLALAVWWFLLRKKKSGLLAERALRLPPHELALRQLAELERRQYWQQGQIKTYYTELTRIVREYLEHRYQIPALESATDDILHLLADTDMPEPLHGPLADLLRWADLTKFAKGAPPEHFHAQALREARRLVEQTRPVEQPDTAPQNSKLKTQN